MSAIGTENAIDTARTLVIGYGNSLRGDDGVGLVAAHKLGELVDPRCIGTLEVQQLTPELCEPISRMNLVIFVDAARDVAAGDISSRLVYAIPAGGSGAQRSTTHQLTPDGLLTFAYRVYGRCPQAHLFTIGGSDFSQREGLSDAVERSCNILVQRIFQRICNRRDCRCGIASGHAAPGPGPRGSRASFAA